MPIPLARPLAAVVMSWIDMVAAMVAQRHCDSEVVTASIDSVSFEHPVHVGDQVTLLASVNYVGVCSFEVGVKVLFYHPETGLDILATKAYLTFVSIDDQHHPVPAPRLEPQTPDEKRRWRKRHSARQGPQGPAKRNAGGGLVKKVHGSRFTVHGCLPPFLI